MLVRRSPPGLKRRPAMVPGFRQWQPRNGRRWRTGAIITNVQAIKTESPQAAVSLTQGATGHRMARAGLGAKRKNLAKKTIAKPHAGKASKADAILKLLDRKNGASIADLQKATGWQPHSVRGFLSGTVKRRLGLRLQSERTGKGARRYLIAPA